MSNRFANGRKAFGFCDVCGFRFDLKRLKNLVVKTKETQIKACPQCWTPDQPQLQLGMYPISDPQALRNPRPDTNTWYQSGVNAIGNVSEGMLVIQWGWNPIGGARDFDAVLTPNTLVGVGQVGQVTIGSTGTPAFTLVEVLYTTPGVYNWTAPAGVTSIYVLCIGGGGSGGLNGGAGINGGRSSFANPLFYAERGGRGSLSAGAGGDGTALSTTVFGGNGGNGGPSGTTGSSLAVGGGGGAGGYFGNGGRGGSSSSLIGARLDGNGGAGAGGSAALLSAVGGGGVGISGVGASGVGDGAGGSGGTNGTSTGGGVYGGGGGGKRTNISSSGAGGGGGGGLRWTPGLAVTPGNNYSIVVGSGGTSGFLNSGGSGAVKIAYWQPVP